LAFSPDGKTLAFSTGDNVVKIWDVSSRQERSMLDLPAASLAISPDGKILAAGSSNGWIQLLNPVTGKTIQLWDPVAGKAGVFPRLPGHAGPVLSVAFSPDGKTLASGGSDGKIKLWDPVTGQERATLEGDTDAVFSLAFRPDGRMLASGSVGVVMLWAEAELWEEAEVGEQRRVPAAPANLVD
jgi:WD40 repeat protein